jgi:hypothetical protein
MRSGKRSALGVHVPLDIDCCQSEGKNISFDDIHFDMPLKNIINYLEDLRVASHKIDDVIWLISEQGWKM